MCTSRSRATANCFGSLPSTLATSSTPAPPGAGQAGHGGQVVALLGPQAAPGDLVLACQLGPGRLKPGFGVGEGDRGFSLGRLPGVPAEELHVVGMAARAAHQQAQGVVFPGHVAAGRRLDQGQACRARLQVAELFDREAAGVGPGAGQALPEDV